MGTESASLETKVRLQQCAVCEFMEKGFLKASLRSICREAGVTTGALYFFFQDKDDLFVPASYPESAVKHHPLKKQTGHPYLERKSTTPPLSLPPHGK